ncbi:MAG: alpha-amylase family glycosyl hydrolase [Actinomycetota bacterium]|nr:alpha-amylase family glycosyl hydrolase [Actinomycetota bacterium]
MTAAVTAALALQIPADAAAAARPAALSASPVSTADMTNDVVYQLLTDRFYDGDTSNDNPSAAPNESSSNHSNWQLYWGGDFAGVTAKMQYLSDLGVGAIWISPPVQNINVPIVDGSATSAGYHGYWGMDYFVPDPHFGSWAAFDAMVSSAHAHGIKIIMDWAANHTSPEDTANANYGVDGALKKNGTTLSEYDNDPNGYFHHNGGVSDYSDRYQVEYENLFNLADLAQENPAVTTYLENAVDTWLSHGIDGIRMDAVKHMPGGFLKSYLDHVYASYSVFVYGEWADPSTAPLWGDEVKFANTDGQSLQNFDLNTSIRNVFASGASMSELNAAVGRQQSSFNWSNQLVDFVDSQDVSRFLSVNTNTTLFDQATVVNMTVPGMPSIYYGDEQYLHNDATNSVGQVGGDPYNRPMMSSFAETSRNFGIVKSLAALRKSNPALRYGSSTERWLNNDVYVYERKFYNNVVLVAVNKSGTDYQLSNLNTALPTGSYSDVLGNALGGGTLTVGTGSGGNNPAGGYTLKAGQAAVWSSVAPAQSTPQLGNIGPTVGHAGDVVAVTGANFGAAAGTVTVGGSAATVKYWSSTEVDFTIPAGAAAGADQVQLTSSAGVAGNTITDRVETGAQTPVTFTVTGTSTSPGDELYLAGNVAELGNWSTDTAVAIGPALDPNYPTWFVMAAVPAGTTVQYKFFIRKANGSIVWEGGANHSYTVPTGGTGAVSVAWQN